MISTTFYERLVMVCHNLLLDNPGMLKYLTDSRKISIHTIRSYKFGYFPRKFNQLFAYMDPVELREADIIYNADSSRFEHHPLVIPIRDVSGKAIAIGCRSLLPETKLKEIGKPKYLNSSYSKTSHLFGLDKAYQSIRNYDQAIVVEGYFDAITAHQGGYYNVVATCGTLFSFRQLAMLSRYTKNICLLFDNDSAGRINSERILRKFENTPGIKFVVKFTPDGYKDLDEYIKSNPIQNILD